VPRYDITETNLAVERLLEVTENPRHRYLLESYNRHRYLEMAGRYEEIFTPQMTVEHPVYRFSLIDRPRLKLDGQAQVTAYYRHLSETAQHVFYAKNEMLAVADHMVVSRAIVYQQTLGSELAERGVDADSGAMYLTKANIAMIWPYDDRGRMMGEDVWEYDDTDRGLIRLEPEDVLTTEQAAELLRPLIKPLPPFPQPIATRERAASDQTQRSVHQATPRP
jgi:hypothetical protein